MFKRICAFFNIQKISYPQGSLTGQEILSILKKEGFNKQNTIHFRKEMGSWEASFEREGDRLPDNRIMYYTEFDGGGYYDYLIINGKDEIHNLDVVERQELRNILVC